MPLLSDPSFFVDAAVVAARTAEDIDANTDWAGGLNVGASCSDGVGINEGFPNVSGQPQQFTLQDQYEAPRTPQDGQYIGGTGLAGTYPSSGGSSGQGTIPIRLGTNAANGSGVITPTGNATLASLAAGWTAAV